MGVMLGISFGISCFSRFPGHFSTFSTGFSTGSVFSVIRFVISVLGAEKAVFSVNIQQAEKQDNTVHSKAGGKMMVRDEVKEGIWVDGDFNGTFEGK
jgi:hypothetical protein